MKDIYIILFNSKPTTATEPSTTLAEAEIKANSVDATVTTPPPALGNANGADNAGKKCTEGDADCRSFGHPDKKGLDS